MRTLRTALFLALATGLAACTAEAPAPAPEPSEPIASAEPAPAPEPGAADAAGAASGSWPAAEATANLVAASEPGVGGTLTFAIAEGGVHVGGRLGGLAPGSAHGFHVHEVGSCEPPAFDSAGPHFNPEASAHGDRASGGAHHAGDIPNQVADGNGEAVVDQYLAGLEIGSGGAHDIVGRAVIVHADADDYATQPSGNAGSRLACGVIVLTQAPPPAGVGPADEPPAEAPPAR